MDYPDASQPVSNEAFMTLERFGMCHRFSNCFVCCTCCRDEMRLHHGSPGDVNTQRPGEIPDDTVLARAVVPIGGGGCTPTVELFSRIAPGALDEEVDTNGTPGIEARMGVVEGPMCFGGCKDFFCETNFYVNETQGAGEEGTLAAITKQTPNDCSSWCTACCSTADTYNLVVTEQGQDKWTPEQKAMIMGEMVHMDYMFFEADKFPCEVSRQGDTTWISILCCLCYCYGCLCPIKCSIPCKDEGGGGGGD
jgi:hypothetical protein